jgi:hypothetical protein
MSSVIRLGTVAKDSQYRSTIALPIRSRARTSGRFSNRDIVDCEHNSRSMGERSRAILNMIAAQRIGVVAVLVAGADHQQSKTDDVRQAVRDLIGRARIDHAVGEPIGDPKPLFDFAQRQNPAIRRQQAAVEFDHDRLAGSG